MDSNWIICPHFLHPPTSFLPHFLSIALPPSLFLSPPYSFPSCPLPVLPFCLICTFCPLFHCLVTPASLFPFSMCSLFSQALCASRNIVIGRSRAIPLQLLLFFSCKKRALSQLNSGKCQGRTPKCLSYVSIPGSITGLWLECDDWSGVEDVGTIPESCNRSIGRAVPPKQGRKYLTRRRVCYNRCLSKNNMSIVLFCLDLYFSLVLT